jgi:hypothetical protein
MTVPGSDISNIVVGESLLEFLALGTRTGHFPLEQLAYYIDQFCVVLDEGRDGYSCSDPKLLGRLVEQFDLSPWSDHRMRLNELAALYGGLIQQRADA